MLQHVDTSRCIREARRRAGLSQAELARRAGTSQATLSAYESGRKEPTVATFDRLLAAAGARLTVVPAARRPEERDEETLARTSRRLRDVLLLAEALPARHAPALRYPRLP